MRDDSARLDISQTTVDVPEKLHLFEEGLVGRHVNENRRSSPLLGQHDRAARVLYLSEQAICPGLEIRGWMNVFGQIK
jgi:hypothetical protein